MLLICVTHAEARNTKAEGFPESFRALTERGRGHVKQAAVRFLSILPTVMPNSSSENIAIGKIVSSPLARCVETAIVFADVIRARTRTSEIYVSDHLKEKETKEERLAGADLESAAKEHLSDIILLATHGDLAGALPPSAKLASPHDQGWFKGGPAWTLIEYKKDDDWKNARVLYCEILSDGGWNILIK